MADSDGSDIRASFQDLIAGASLEVLLPCSSDSQVENTLQSHTRNGLTHLPSRESLFFDELATAIIVLTLSSDEDDVEKVLPHLEIVVAAYANEDGTTQGTGSTAFGPGKHEITSRTIPASQHDDRLVVNERVHLIWKHILHLTRPRVKLHRPAVYIVASLNTTSKALPDTRHTKPEIMKRYEALPRNILEALRYDPALQGVNVQLSENRVTKVSSTAATPRDECVALRGVSKRALPFLPALFTRIRYTTLADAVIASLHLETAATGPRNVVLTDVRLEVPDAEADDLTQLAFPRETATGDEVVILKKLKRKLGSVDPGRVTVTARIEASASTDEIANIPVLITWQSKMSFASEPPKPIYKWSRAAPDPLSQMSVATLPSTIGRASGDTGQTSAIGAGSVIFNFTAAPTTKRTREVQMGVQCINRSGRSRRFALVSMPAKHAPAKFPPSPEVTKMPPILEATRTEARTTPSVIELRPGLRIGPLLSGTSFETSMKFCAFVNGVLDLGSVRIVDLDTGQTVDVRQLPSAVANMAEEGD